MLTLITGGEVYAPEPLGKQDVLLVDGKIGKVGDVNRASAESLGLGLEVIDAKGCVVTPGFIDAHQHLLGGSGEKGFSSQTPEISLSEIVTAGITTVVGCLGVDTTMKTMAGLLAKAKGLNEEGITAYIWTGGYSMPPTAILGTVRQDLMFISEAIGCGEIAIADQRSEEPSIRDLARVVTDAYVGGMLSRKAGVTHFHVGEGQRRMQCLFDLLDSDFEVDACCLYPTHVERSEELMHDAIALTKRGCTVDIDVVQGDLHKWYGFYLENGGDPSKITASSDAAITSPHMLFEQIRKCVCDHGFSLEQMLPLVTSNAADVLRLEKKGRLATAKDGDILLLRAGTLELDTVIAGGKTIVRHGLLRQTEHFLHESNRRITLHGQKH